MVTKRWREPEASHPSDERSMRSHDRNTLGAVILLAVLSPFAQGPDDARAQGAIIETLEQLKDIPSAPEFRGALPPRFDVSSNIPPPKDQGPSGTCTSWAATYGAASQALRRASLGRSLALSPSFTYNKIASDPRCLAGTAPSDTLDMLKNTGALPFEEFVFDGGWCGRLPTADELQRAGHYKIKGWTKLNAKMVEEVKAQLARGVPVIFLMRPNDEFHKFKGDKVLDIPGVMNGGGHAMLAVGYDDARQAFRIQNSWGRGFGDGGYAWLSYEFFSRNVGEAGYVID
jgi:hypothetical protein